MSGVHMGVQLSWVTLHKQVTLNKASFIHSHNKLEIAQSEHDVSPFCKESDMTYSWKRQFGLFLRQ